MTLFIAFHNDAQP